VGVADVNKPTEQCDVMDLDREIKSVEHSICFSELQYCDISIEGHSEPVVALKDKGSEICLIKKDLVRDWDLPSIGMVKIRGAFGEPVEAKLVALKIKPDPGVGFENIAPSFNVIFAVCALTTDVGVILCGSAVEGLDELSAYNVPKPTVVPANVSAVIKSETHISDAITDSVNHDRPELQSS